MSFLVPATFRIRERLGGPSDLEEQQSRSTMYRPIIISLEPYHEVMHQSFPENLSPLKAAGYACASKLTVNASPFRQRFTQSEFLSNSFGFQGKRIIFDGSSKSSVSLRNNL